MRQWIALMKKEMLESRRDAKRLIWMSLFVFFGLMSPLAAKLTPEIIRLFATTPDMAGILLLIPEPDVYAAYEQFIKNTTQLLIMSVLVVLMGIVSQDKADGSVILLLSKGVPRYVFILSKFATAILLTSLAYWTSVLLFAVYTQLLFGGFMIPSTATIFVMLWVYLVFFAAAAVLASTLSKTVGMSALLSFGFFFLLLMISSLPVLRDWSPALLGSLPSKFLHGVTRLNMMIKPLITGIVGTVLFGLFAVSAFSRQEL